MKKNGLSVWILLLSGVLMVACGKEIPGDIIQPDAMEDLLYDYHLASSMENSLPYTENYKKLSYQNYVFKKHQVTQAEFDSSMVWYTRHSAILSEMYGRLRDRYKKTGDYLKLMVEKREGQVNVFLSGDSVDIWQDRSLFWLTTEDYTNKVVFSLKPDTTFRVSDRLDLRADFMWVPSAVKDTSRSAVMGLNIYLQNDSVVGKTLLITKSGTHHIDVQSDMDSKYDRIEGFIYYNAPSSEQSQLLVNHITLNRYHQKDSVSLHK